MSTKQTKYMGEGVEHRTEKARQFGLARAAGQGAIEEYPVGDGRFIADLAVFDIDKNGKMKLVKLVEVVVTSPPTKEKLEYYKELGLECEVVYIEKREPPKQMMKKTAKKTNQKKTIREETYHNFKDNDKIKKKSCTLLYKHNAKILCNDLTSNFKK
ncbi:hypothetical protein T492DRAFT_842825 [Pavlovales sp. CCMP2436]|nr:hypothetical protein T492DRAFT_842825 [Pavlovales sp. CCMP2436]